MHLRWDTCSRFFRGATKSAADDLALSGFGRRKDCGRVALEDLRERVAGTFKRKGEGARWEARRPHWTSPAPALLMQPPRFLPLQKRAFCKARHPCDVISASILIDSGDPTTWPTRTQVCSCRTRPVPLEDHGVGQQIDSYTGLAKGSLAKTCMPTHAYPECHRCH